MKRQGLILILLGVMLSSGCATSAVRGIGQRRVCDNGGHAIIWNSGDISVVRERSELTGLNDKCVSRTNAYFAVPAHAINIKERIPSDHVMTVEYSRFPQWDTSTVASRMASFNGSDGRIAVLGSRAAYLSVTNEAFKVLLMPVGLVEIDTYHTALGKVAQVLLVPAVAVDLVTFPIQLIGALIVADMAPRGH